ncbi:MAG TPA: Bax inhibitor-1/YccA family protein [Pyrinomonadaceae bacterium]
MSWNQSSPYTPASVSDERVTSFLAKVYLWMFVGLLITSGTAYVVAYTPALVETFILNRFLFWILLFAQLGLVWFLSARISTMSPTVAAGMFMLYSGLVGVTTSVILLAYTASSIASTFVITAGMFGVTALLGTITKRSLAGVGQFMFMGLIGLILASIVNIFVQSSLVYFVISVVGIIVFTGLTAWDAQRLKHMAIALPEGQLNSYAVVGALSLYLDFINLFFMLLRLTGGRRN